MYKVGQTIKFKYGGIPCSGIITRIREDSTIDVLYTNGNFELNIKEKNIEQ